MDRQLPSNLIETTGCLLASHVGREQAIKLTAIRQILFSISHDFRTINEKQIRAVIGILRDKGKLICSLGSDSDGYYTACSRKEFEEFKSYYLSFSLTIFERVRKMDAKAREQWGEGTQPALL